MGLEDEVARLRVTQEKMLRILTLVVKEKLPEIEEKIRELDPRLRQTRRGKTHETWVKVKEAQLRGVSNREIARDMGIPYSTVCAYVKMAPDEVAILKSKADYVKAFERFSATEAAALTEAYEDLLPDPEDDEAYAE